MRPTQPLVLGLAILLASCAPTSKLVGSVTGATQEKEEAKLLVELQGDVMGFADVYVSEVLEGMARIPAQAPSAQLEVLEWRARQATAAYDIATSPNPRVNAANAVVLTILSRMVAEDYWSRELPGPETSAVVSIYRSLEPRAWNLTSNILTPEQCADLKQLVLEWRAGNPETRDVAFVRLEDLAKFAANGGMRGLGKAGSVLAVMGLDPFGGLDPAVKQMEESRVLAERAFYFAKRWPRLLDLQVQQLSFRLSLQPSSQQALGDVHRFAVAAEDLSRAAAELPEFVSREREASIGQFMGALEAQESKARILLAEMRRALDSGDRAAGSVNQAVQSLEAFVRLVNPPSPGARPGRPFDVNEYTRALEQLGRSARDLDGLLRSAGIDVPRLAVLLDQATVQAEARGQALVELAFRRVVTASLIGVVSTLLAAIVFQIAVERIRSRDRTKGDAHG